MSAIGGRARCNLRSTRDRGADCGFSAALLQGLAPDGGLYVPRALARARVAGLRRGRRRCRRSRERLLAPFVAGDALAAALPAIAREAFNFPGAAGAARRRTARLAVLELFHGPTAAFKDFGARFLAACLPAAARRPDARPLTILVATSGDTGGAVAAAFHRRPASRSRCCFPKGLVSPTQEQQLTCWGGNVHVARGARHASTTASAW